MGKRVKASKAAEAGEGPFSCGMIVTSVAELEEMAFCCGMTVRFVVEFEAIASSRDMTVRSMAKLVVELQIEICAAD